MYSSRVYIVLQFLLLVKQLSKTTSQQQELWKQVTKPGVTFMGCLLVLSLASSSLIFTAENEKGDRYHGQKNNKWGKTSWRMRSWSTKLTLFWVLGEKHSTSIWWPRLFLSKTELQTLYWLLWLSSGFLMTLCRLTLRPGSYCSNLKLWPFDRTT